MEKYNLVSPDHYTNDQKLFVNRFIDSILMLSEQTDIIMGAKDIHSRHIISTDAYAKIVALDNGKEVAGKFDKEMPCEGTAQFADCYVQEDKALINSKDLNKKISILNVKIGVPSTRVTDLRNALVHAGMHHKMPKTLFNRIIGSRPL